MKTKLLLLLVFVLLITVGVVSAQDCTTIQSGELMAKDGITTLVVGYDQWSYNYQAHMFNGPYCNNTRSADDACWAEDYANNHLQMKWNDAWLSNKSCDGDNQLDRHYGFDSYIGSGAWLTNHEKGDGWTYFVKIVAVPSDAYKVDGIWYAADGTEIGPVIWGAFAIVEEVVSGEGATYISPYSTSFEDYAP